MLSLILSVPAGTEPQCAGQSLMGLLGFRGLNRIRCGIDPNRRTTCCMARIRLLLMPLDLLDLGP